MADDPTPETGDPAAPTTDPAVEPETDLAAEVEKWKGLARKNEDRAKQNAEAAKRLREVERDAMSEQERAVDEARTQAERAAAERYGSKLVAAEVRAAAAGRDIDADALLDGISTSRFLTDDGEVDRDALSQWIDRVAPVRDDKPDSTLR